MDLGKKIDEIRAKPEHIREKYLWVSVMISMILLLGVWLITLKSSLFNKQRSEDVSELKKTFQDAKDSVAENTVEKVSE